MKPYILVTLKAPASNHLTITKLLPSNHLAITSYSLKIGERKLKTSLKEPHSLSGNFNDFFRCNMEEKDI